MAFKFNDLTDDVRRYMEDEVKLDIAKGTLYYSKWFTEEGKKIYPNLLLKSILNGNEETLAASLRGHFKTYYERKKPNGGTTMAQAPYTANVTFAEGEFNRFYIRALCRKAIDTNKKLRVYRAKLSENPRPESEMLIGREKDAVQLLNDLRTNVGTDSVLGLPPGPNSGLSVEIIK